MWIDELEIDIFPSLTFCLSHWEFWTHLFSYISLSLFLSPPLSLSNRNPIHLCIFLSLCISFSFFDNLGPKILWSFKIFRRLFEWTRSTLTQKLKFVLKIFFLVWLAPLCWFYYFRYIFCDQKNSFFHGKPGFEPTFLVPVVSPWSKH